MRPIPRARPFYLLLCVLDVRCLLSLYKALHNERLEELKRHLFRKSALINLELGSNDDNRTSRIVDTLTEEVLTEASLLTAKHLGERLERTVARSRYGLAASAVIYQGVDSLLKHSFLVADNDIGRSHLEQILQTVVSADNAAVKIVQVGCRKASAVELYHRTDIRRNYRDNVQYHPLGTVAGLTECLDYLKALADAQLLLSRCARELCAKVGRELVEIKYRLGEQLLDSLCAHADAESVLVLFVVGFILALGQQLIADKRGITGIYYYIGCEVKHLFECAKRYIEQQTHTRGDRSEIPDVRDGAAS